MATGAVAGVSHEFDFNIAGSGTTALSGPTDVGVDQSSHAIYVTDPGNRRVLKFDSTGNFVLMFGKAVNQTTGGDVCTAASGNTCQAGTAGSGSGQFTTPTFLAVDNSTGPSAGDVYVSDTGTDLVQKFDSSGHVIPTWGALGQQDGSGTPYAEGTGWAPFGGQGGIDVDPMGHLFVTVIETGALLEYSQDGTFREYGYACCGGFGFKVDSAGSWYVSDSQRVIKVVPIFHSGNTLGPLTSTVPTTGFAFDLSSYELYQDIGTEIAHYSANCDPTGGTCDPADSFGSGQLFGPRGLAVDASSGTVYVANSTSNDVSVFGDVRPKVTTGPPSNVNETSVTLNAHIDPAGRGAITGCYFEYGFDTTYGATVPCVPDPASSPPGSNFTAPTDVTATITGLSPGTREHYRVVVSNSADATTYTPDQIFITTQPPAINGLASANLTATTADLNAQLNPNGLDTTYRFEYGPTTSYGQSAPVPDGSLSASNADQAIGVHLANLTPHVVYHYTLVATNADGTTTAPDHTFNFYPPDCPNENVRQQTQANYLPDCRAYELVSPADAGGTQLYPSGPNTGYAESPSRLSFTGLWATIPNSGGEPLDQTGDLYVATRTGTGWVTRYVGLPSSQVAVAGGPPQGLPGSGNLANGFTAPDRIQRDVLTNPAMDTFLDWNDGNQVPSSAFPQNETPVPSNAPYVWSADGTFRDRWPTNLATVPDGLHTHFEPTGDLVDVQAGGVHALDCPPVQSSAFAAVKVANECPGDVTASLDLSHFVFSTRRNVFAAGGLLNAPGSVYDNDTRAGTTVVASLTPGGEGIPKEALDNSGATLRIPAVSADGSHILMAAGGIGQCGTVSCPVPPCGNAYAGAAIRCPIQPSHLYMRVDGVVTYDVSRGKFVEYLGSTADGTRVYFSSAESLLPDDQDTSVDLYMWSEGGDLLSLVSQGIGGSGNSDACSAVGTLKCGVTTFSPYPYCQLPGGLGGNCGSDSFVASESGDVYFQSPEQLDGTRGIPNQQNLYLFSGGDLTYVATFTTGSYCTDLGIIGFIFGQCSSTPIVRMQVTPDDSHMALVTASPLTQYDNAGHLEMYTYDPAAALLICVSCNPSGDPPTSDVRASQNGLFMTNDGRVFFGTSDGLVHGDTNQGIDVYEYVDGRPQLITLGTGETRERFGRGAVENPPGLVGVSAGGTDAYFTTLDTLVREDHNGLFIKFYDARSGGGVSAPAPPPPCEAADECHGPSSSAPAAMPDGTAADLSGGNIQKATTKRHKRSRRKRHPQKRRRGGHTRSQPGKGHLDNLNRYGQGGSR